jgi:hypothetical protein
MVTAKKIRLVNPEKRGLRSRSKRAPRKARKANPGPLYILGAVNPQRKTSMKKPAKKKKNRAARKSNPFPKVRAKQRQFKPKRNGRRRRNPDFSGALNQPIEFLKFGLIALLGLVATRQVPQTMLGTKNTSWTGYLANLATALAGSWGAGRFAGKRAALAFGTGGGLYVVNRFLTDKFTPVGQVLSLAGLGDAQASSRLGGIVPGAIYPPSYDARGNLRLPPAVVSAMRAAMAPAPATAGGGMSGTRMRSSRIAA